MKNLINLQKEEGKLVVGSREVASNFQKNHRDVLESIRNLIDGVAEKSADLFIEAEYQHSQNMQWYREYLLTRDGFSLLVMGFTGQKALEWKLKYIEAFNKMEESLQQPRKLSAMDQLRLQYEVVEEHEERLTNLENTMTIDYGQQLELKNLVSSTAIQTMGGKESLVYMNNSIRRKVFANIWRDFKDYFQINSYKNTPRKDLTKAIEYIRTWNPQGKLLREIEEVNISI